MFNFTHNIKTGNFKIFLFAPISYSEPAGQELGGLWVESARADDARAYIQASARSSNFLDHLFPW